jgi:hypothetical protein
MSEKQAFPNSYHGEEHKGMTLRDYFAAKAMNSLISDPDWRSDMVWHETAYAAYQMADAMMKAREHGNS